MIPRILEAERLIMDLRARVASLEQRIAQVGQSVGAVWSGQTGGSGGGGGGGAFICLSIPAIAGGTFGNADVYLLTGGSPGLYAPGAVIWNGYASATTAGRKCTLGMNPDGSFLIFGQSCT